MEVLPEAMLFNLRIIFMVADSTHDPTTQTLNPSNPTSKIETFSRYEREKPNFLSPHLHFKVNKWRTKPNNNLIKKKPLYLSLSLDSLSLLLKDRASQVVSIVYVNENEKKFWIFCGQTQSFHLQNVYLSQTCNCGRWFFHWWRSTVLIFWFEIK